MLLVVTVSTAVFAPQGGPGGGAAPERGGSADRADADASIVSKAFTALTARKGTSTLSRSLSRLELQVSASPTWPKHQSAAMPGGTPPGLSCQQHMLERFRLPGGESCSAPSSAQSFLASAAPQIGPCARTQLL